MTDIELYKKHATPPENAIKPIVAGRLKGKSDINPQWRIEALTETFGLCGFGWYPKITNRWIEEGSSGEKAAYVEIELFVKYNSDWSMPISATGGSMFVSKEKERLYTSDEAFKMAFTDAISVACKMIGIASDVYRGKMNDSKYSRQQPTTTGTQNAQVKAPAPQQAPKPQRPLPERARACIQDLATKASVSEISDYYKSVNKLLNELLSAGMEKEAETILEMLDRKLIKKEAA